MTDFFERGQLELFADAETNGRQGIDWVVGWRGERIYTCKRCHHAYHEERCPVLLGHNSNDCDDYCECPKHGVTN